jgi:hypothetical protein
MTYSTVHKLVFFFFDIHFGNNLVILGAGVLFYFFVSFCASVVVAELKHAETAGGTVAPLFSKVLGDGAGIGQYIGRGSGTHISTSRCSYCHHLWLC